MTTISVNRVQEDRSEREREAKERMKTNAANSKPLRPKYISEEKDADAVHATLYNCILQRLSIFHVCNQEFDISIGVVYIFC